MDTRGTKRKTQNIPVSENKSKKQKIIKAPKVKYVDKPVSTIHVCTCGDNHECTVSPFEGDHKTEIEERVWYHNNIYNKICCVTVSKTKNGKKDRKIHTFHNGIKIKEENYRNGIKIKEENYRNGIKIKEENYKNGKLTEYSHFYNDGSVFSHYTYHDQSTFQKTSYVCSKQYQFSRLWYKNGQLKDETYIHKVDDKKNYNKTYYSNGNLQFKKFYNKTYYSNSNLLFKKLYKENIWITQTFYNCSPSKIQTVSNLDSEHGKIVVKSHNFEDGSKTYGTFDHWGNRLIYEFYNKDGLLEVVKNK
jgi:antitoxin component YwqK of YwqJK toxin-antitoxin module